MKHLLSELRRRNVFRVAAAYLVVGWLVMQIVSVMTPALQLPGWVDGFFAVFIIACLPIALLLAWAFEMTPAGVKKTEAVDGAVEFRPLGGTDFILIGLMVVVLGVIGFQMVSRDDAPADVADSSEVVATPITDIETVQAPVLDASIAVLPFADFSPGGDQQYFSDGIAEELLNSLAQFPDLKVAARTSAFSFRGEEHDLRDVGEALDVAHVLEGSVRHAGDRVRITAQLIRVSDGFHLWSETYDRTMTDVFEVQDDIVTELSRVLQVRLGVGGGVGRASSREVDPNAYEQYLRGLSLWANRLGFENRAAAIRAFAQVTQIDPGFAEGWASYGHSLAMSAADVIELSKDEQSRRVVDALTRALDLDPDNARAHAGFAVHYFARELDIERALEHAQRATEIAPNAAYTNYNRAAVLFGAGESDAAQNYMERSRAIDTLNDLPTVYFAYQLGMSGHISRAQATYSECLLCDDMDRAWMSLNASLQAGSPEQVRQALATMAAVSDVLAIENPELAAQYSADMAWVTDYAEGFLGTENAGNLALATLVDEDADIQDAAFLAHMSEDQRALDVLFLIYQNDEFFVRCGWILHPGRFEFPERTRRLPRYHEFWAQPGMPELAAMRRANGQTGGLPLPMEPVE
jgi:TolB-like protein